MSNIYYLNTRNESVDFVKDLPLLDINDLYQSGFDTISNNNMITGFSRGIKTVTIEGDIFTDSFDKISDIFDYDIYKNERGRFYIGEYFMYCNISVVKPSGVNLYKKKLTTDITITTDMPFWLKESKYSFVKSADSKEKGFTYPFKYPFTYGNSQGLDSITNDSLKSSDFMLYIYGPVSNPSISIGNNIYSVNTDVTSQEYLVIDSRRRETYKVNNIGDKENMFAYRSFEDSLFSKIQPGLNNVSWSASFGFDLYVYDERSKPKWISYTHQ